LHPPKKDNNLTQKAFKFIIYMGIVSLMGDMTYEGARSIIGPYLASLGASGTVVGFVIGIADLVGYGFRGISGYIGDKTKQYWLLAFIGYLLIFTIPLMAFTSSWQIIVILILIERLGKSIRSPSRDAMLSYATFHVGRGKGFGIHEALNQIGSLIGPAIIALFLFWKNNYHLALAFLFYPYLLAILMLVQARISYPNPQELEEKVNPPVPITITPFKMPKSFWIYFFAVGLVFLGYADFALISYHFSKTNLLSPGWIPIFYGIAMGCAGISAFFIGRLFDKKGIAILIFVTAISAFFAPCVFLGNVYLAVLGSLLWGFGIGSQEAIIRAIIAHTVPQGRRGSAYGLLFMGIGLFWFVGGILIGFLYDISPKWVVIFSISSQIAALPLFILIKNNKIEPTPPPSQLPEAKL
jgi:MFS family permease